MTIALITICGYALVGAGFAGWSVACQENDINAGTRKETDDAMTAVIGIFWPICIVIMLCAVPFVITKKLTARHLASASLPKATAKEKSCPPPP